MKGPIVVGTDGSDTANIAVAAAIELAKTFKQPLHVVSAFRPISVPGNLPAEFDGCITSSSKVDSVVSEAMMRAKAAGVTVTAHAETGSAADALLSVAEEVQADLIVVGNRGIRSKTRYVLGNVPSKVVHHAMCSTYVVQTS